TRGAPFYVQDTLVTDKTTTRAEIRFTDGTVVALRPDTTFKVDSYQYQPTSGQGGKGGTFQYAVDLAKGGFRSVSAAISKKNPEAYKVTTPVATIGIRGTDFSLIINKHGALAAGMYHGSISINNSAGCIVIGGTGGCSSATNSAGTSSSSGATQNSSGTG